MSEKEKITRAVGIVGSATLLSRIFGLVRDQVTAYFFGTGLAADAFFVAFRIPNLLRRLLAEGALTVSLVPIFTEYLTTRSRQEAFELARVALTFFSILLAAVAILGIIFSPYIVWVFAPGFTSQPDKFALTVLLTRIMFPYIFLVGLVALAMGVLNSLGRFAAPALSPVFLNIGIILTVLVFSDYFDLPIVALALGVLVGGLLQVLLQIPSLAREKGLLGLSMKFGHPALKKIGLLMLPATLGAAVYQITIFINTLLASFLPEGSVSYLYYADRIMQFPLGVFAVAVGTAVLPSLSRQASQQDLPALIDTFSYAQRLIFFITMPAMVGMIVLADPIITLLFQRGEFDQVSSLATAQALIAYALGLWSLSSVQVVVRVFYSLQDTATPAKLAVVTLIGNTILGLLLMGPLKHVGLALASTGGSILNFIVLSVALRKRLGRLDGRRVIRAVFRYTLWSAAMGAAVFLAVRVSARLLPASTAAKALEVLGGTILGILVYVGLAALWRAPEMDAFRRRVKRRGGS
ncbi:MAG: murein biosynthesis integral membrane protein MurJ [Thermodesulfobacteriota bacterium]